MMLSCKEISKLVSESLETKLTLRQRVELWMHLRLCRLCAAFRRDVDTLHLRTQQHVEELDSDRSVAKAKLSAGARQRIKQAIEARND
ncbi:hypothetical protein CA51_51480 [Rosistilla oblonga]|uniref:Zinc-finger domain-containing protein n=1 Tax=Rosistilla oblonga TaxID=2527990 RepID=A0A518IU47_9BACT|nr:hypothetical protein [Rosistilla oblonga]QDV15235.1 hypothetical protein CA51_51480 [Rosistilla oblonga]QDV56614.1 hypothetical protein Mal33_26060 [Rosistilla oblonga]